MLTNSFLAKTFLSVFLLSVTALQPSVQGRRKFISLTSGVLLGSAGLLGATKDAEASSFKRIPTQFIAALGDPRAQSGKGTEEWGLWTVDPGPRGVFLRDYEKQLEKTNTGPYGWSFTPNDWWLEEHGIIMESPDFPLKAGRYVVTGGRDMTTVLTVDEAGTWQLKDGTLYDVTHLPCRSARYKPKSADSKSCSPKSANTMNFPVRPGATMPSVNGCQKEDYAVLFVIGVEDTTMTPKYDL